MISNQKIYLAPFQGVTTYTYREIYTRYFKGVDKLFTPFFTGIHKVKSLDKRAVELNFTHQNTIEVVPQVLSKDADEMMMFAELCQIKGYKEINWNLGCPYPRVANKKRGSGMLPYPEMLNEILEKLMPQLDIDFSIKCRLGYFSEDEIMELMDVYNSYSISEITIHARIGKQLYSGDVRLEAFKKALAKSKNEVVYNGDIFSVNDFNKFNAEFAEINNWMIGRGLLNDPYLPAIIKGLEVPELEEQKRIIEKFVTDLYLAYRKKMNDRLQAINVMKEYWGFLSHSFDETQKVFNTIKKTKSFDDYEEAVAAAFRNFKWIGSGVFE
jgi:tRNA-dihydrouridine synthase